MSNNVLTIDMITLKALALFRNSNFLIQAVSKKYSAEFARKSAKIGDSLRIRTSSFYTVRNNMTAVAQNTTESNVNLTVDLPVGIDVSFSTTELALNLNDFGEQVLAPVMNTLASGCSTQVMNVVANAQNVVLTNANSVYNTNAAAVSPNVKALLLAGAYLDLKGAPPRGAGNRIACLNPISSANLVESMSGFFNSQSAISRQFEDGEMKLGNLGIDRYGVDQQIPLVTTGTSTGGTVSGSTQTGPSITISALSGTLKTGQYITFQGVNSVNPITGFDTGHLAQFVLTADAAGSATTIAIAPTMVASVGGTVPGANVTALPGGSATFTTVQPASTPLLSNIIFDKQAIEVAFVELPVSSGMVSSSRKTYDGVSVRCVNYYDGTNDVNNSRFDVLMGVTMVRPSWVVLLNDIIS